MWNFSCYFPVILSLCLFSGGKSSSLFWRACFMTLGVLPLPASPYRTPAVTWNHILMDVSTLGAVLDCQIFSWEYILGNFDAGKDWGQEEKRVTEDEMVGWRHRLKGHKFKQTPGDSEGQESLVCCSPWGDKESDTTEWLKNSAMQRRHMDFFFGADEVDTSPTNKSIHLSILLQLQR